MSKLAFILRTAVTLDLLLMTNAFSVEASHQVNGTIQIRSGRWFPWDECIEIESDTEWTPFLSSYVQGSRNRQQLQYKPIASSFGRSLGRVYCHEIGASRGLLTVSCNTTMKLSAMNFTCLGRIIEKCIYPRMCFLLFKLDFSFPSFKPIVPSGQYRNPILPIVVCVKIILAMFGARHLCRKRRLVRPLPVVQPEPQRQHPVAHPIMANPTVAYAMGPPGGLQPTMTTTTV